MKNYPHFVQTLVSELNLDLMIEKFKYTPLIYEGVPNIWNTHHIIYPNLYIMAIWWGQRKVGSC
jgi:hypothetical protein